MASTLDGGGKDRNVTRGHGTGALGPSDSSDTGSDITGGPGTMEGDVIGLDESGTTSDAEHGGRTAGPDIGDAGLDSDSDRAGTGERRAAGRDPAKRADIDRDTDRLQGSDEGGMPEAGSSTGLASDADGRTAEGEQDGAGGGAGPASRGA